MDPIQEIETAVLARQKPMNELIDRFESNIQLFYRNVTVFVTGGSGFIGKQLVEKLFRSCEIKKIYMLLRPKKGKTIQERLQSILNDPLYELLREKQPKFADRIVPVEGDVADIRLGLSDKDWTLLTEEVNVIFHVAATVRFDEPLKVATLINIRGTREALTLAKECKNLKCFNHMSTAFAHATATRTNTDIEEKFYPCPVPPEIVIKMVETVDEDRLNSLTSSLIKDWPNTYTFTKALAEELVRTTAGDMPVCIVKPPVVTSSYIEPAPGWIDLYTCMSSVIGALVAIGLGIMHVILVDRNIVVSYAPVDFVNNATIAASWDAAQRKANGDTKVPLYTVSSSRCGTTWNFFGDCLRTDEFGRLASPKSLWYPYTIETSNKFVYWLLIWLLHYIPAYFVDILVDLLGVRPKGIPPLVKIYTRIKNISDKYEYFWFNSWYFRDDNLASMIQKMSPEDRIIYNCDVNTIDFKELMKAWVVGVRKYVIKDGLRGSDIGYNRQKYLFKYMNAVFFAVYGYLIYLVLYFIYTVSSFLIKCIFT